VGEAKDRTFKAADPRISTWKSVDGVWAYGYWQFDWADSHEKLESYDPSTGLVQLAKPPQKSTLDEYGLAKGRRFFYSNVLEELDQPGETWLDVPNHRLIAWLPDNTRETILSDLDAPLLHLKNVSNVSLEGFLVEAGRGDGVFLENAEACVLKGVTVRNVGMAGVVIDGGKGCGLKACTISGVGEGGVRLSGGDRRTLVPGSHFVEDCYIHHVSRWCQTYRPAVHMEGVGNRVVGNTIIDLPHIAVLMGGNDHLVERNDIRRVCLQTGDAGAIYMGRNTTMRGTVIRWNRFREVEPRTSTEGNFSEVMSVYLDDCHAGIRVEGNIFESSGTAIMLGGGRDNLLEGNIFIGCKPAVSFDARARGWAKDYFTKGWGFRDRINEVPVLESPWRERYPQLYADVKNNVDLSYPGGNTLVSNVSLGGSFVRYLDGLSSKDWASYKDNVVQPLPGTLSMALTLRPKGLPQIPISKIGAAGHR
jgi:hypothetical protein